MFKREIMIREIRKFLDDLITEGYEISLNTQEGDMLITATDNNVTHKDYKFSFFNNILSHVVCLTYRKILEDNLIMINYRKLLYY